MAERSISYDFVCRSTSPRREFSASPVKGLNTTWLLFLSLLLKVTPHLRQQILSDILNCGCILIFLEVTV